MVRQLLPATLAANSLAVQAAYREYQQRALERHAQLGGGPDFALGVAGGPQREHEALAQLKSIAAKNVLKKSLIGMGYYDTITPPVVVRKGRAVLSVDLAGPLHRRGACRPAPAHRPSACWRGRARPCSDPTRWRAGRAWSPRRHAAA